MISEPSEPACCISGSLLGADAKSTNFGRSDFSPSRTARWPGVVRLLARLRHADELVEFLLIGVDRKWPTYARKVEIDPQRPSDQSGRPAMAGWEVFQFPPLALGFWCCPHLTPSLLI